MAYFGTDPLVVQYALDAGADPWNYTASALFCQNNKYGHGARCRSLMQILLVVQPRFTSRGRQTSGSVTSLAAVIPKDVLTFAPPVL